MKLNPHSPSVAVQRGRFCYNNSLAFVFRWFCHFDDDNYVNVPRLVRFLGDYSPREDWYLGKPSIRAPLKIINSDKTSVSRGFTRSYFRHAPPDVVIRGERRPKLITAQSELAATITPLPRPPASCRMMKKATSKDAIVAGATGRD